MEASLSGPISNSRLKAAENAVARIRLFQYAEDFPISSRR